MQLFLLWPEVLLGFLMRPRIRELSHAPTVDRAFPYIAGVKNAFGPGPPLFHQRPYILLQHEHYCCFVKQIQLLTYNYHLLGYSSRYSSA
ncbi:hypothetical protein AUEXF2481DRAFT_675997 [Aureobasidium subglaciale EXF-2481]|uniref:Uncharacterized protein n=1 Tax=Aureobasidium subglaciale (strain EXF-2481) TaxID=1043005 RepID=A0A074Z9V7_AURSE|nr:uncharacterized protein AUEXF2481DRAFT_675997 [Aureobasidium subglaciale EXF-2481]KEQ95566.1 hypothetical protein AUEXF2481DRAFT_675997 [Aureobasidium subglaciale EXF-2481]